MLVKFRQELAFKQQELDSLKRLSQDITAISTAQEISLLQNNKINPPHPYNDRYYSNTLPKINSAMEQKELKNGAMNNSNRVRLSVCICKHVNKMFILNCRKIQRNLFCNFRLKD